MTPAGALTTLVEFTGSSTGLARGAYPVAPLVEDLLIKGSFYGTTSTGGTNGLGTVFTMSAGALVKTSDFNGTNGSDPEAALVQVRVGTSYGTTFYGTAAGGTGTSANGTIYSYDPQLIPQ